MNALSFGRGVASVTVMGTRGSVWGGSEHVVDTAPKTDEDDVAVLAAPVCGFAVRANQDRRLLAAGRHAVSIDSAGNRRLLTPLLRLGLTHVMTPEAAIRFRPVPERHANGLDGLATARVPSCASSPTRRQIPCASGLHSGVLNAGGRLTPRGR